MSREIKFRGKSVKTKEWVYGYAVKRGSEWFIDYETTDWKSQTPLGKIEYHKVRVDEKTIGQQVFYKSDKKVYEGDIDEYGCVITYVDGSKGENLGMDIGFYVQRYNFESWRLLMAGEDIEIVGNKYDNPEMLWENK